MRPFRPSLFLLLLVLVGGERPSLVDEALFVQVSHSKEERGTLKSATWGLANTSRAAEVEHMRDAIARGNHSGWGKPKASNIVVVSGCISDNAETYAEGAEICEIAKKNFQNYCGYQGYRLVFFDVRQPLAETRKSTWSKIVAVQKVLEDAPRADYVFWMDSDSLFMNFSRRLEDLIPRRGTHLSFGAGRFCFLNAGHLMFTNDAWTGRFLEDVWKTFPPPKPWHEQSAMVYTLWSYSEGRGKMKHDPINHTLLETSSQRSRGRASAAECRQWTKEIQTDPLGCCNGKIMADALHEELGVSLIDQREMREMNSFEYNFVPGDFILHLAGDTASHKTLKMRWYSDCVLDPRSSSYAQDYQKLDDLSRERKANSSMRKWQL